MVMSATTMTMCTYPQVPLHQCGSCRHHTMSADSGTTFSTEKIRCEFWRAHALSLHTPASTHVVFRAFTRLFATGRFGMYLHTRSASRLVSSRAPRSPLIGSVCWRTMHHACHALHAVLQPINTTNTTVACFVCHRYETDASEELDSYVLGTPHLDEDDGVGNDTRHLATGRLFALSICCTTCNTDQRLSTALLVLHASKTIDGAPRLIEHRACGCVRVCARMGEHHTTPTSPHDHHTTPHQRLHTHKTHAQMTCSDKRRVMPWPTCCRTSCCSRPLATQQTQQIRLLHPAVRLEHSSKSQM